MNYIILSANKTNVSDRDNLMRYEELLDLMTTNGVPCYEVMGSYQGHQEPSIVFEWSERNERLAQELCSDFDQDCYLVTGKNKWHGLYDRDGKLISDLGKYKLVSELEGQQNYTQINSKYMVSGG